MARPLGRRGRGAWPVMLGLLLAMPARADDPPAPRWVGADASIYLEVRRPSLLLDRVLSEPFQDVLHALPDYAKALEGDGARKPRAVVGFLEDKLGTTWDRGLRDLTGGGIVLAIG